jgi:hypothetical protein
VTDVHDFFFAVLEISPCFFFCGLFLRRVHLLLVSSTSRDREGRGVIFYLFLFLFLFFGWVFGAGFCGAVLFGFGFWTGFFLLHDDGGFLKHK